MAYELVEVEGTYEIGRMDGRLVAACECGAGMDVLDKGLGRATLAAWKTRHKDCGA